MKPIRQYIRLTPTSAKGVRLPMLAVGRLLSQLPHAAWRASRMAVSGSAKGKPQQWVNRFLNFDIYDVTRGRSPSIVVDAPRLKDAAPQLFEQMEFWSTSPNPDATAIDFLGQVIRDVEKSRSDSDVLDRQLLSRIALFKKITDRHFSDVVLDGLTADDVHISAKVMDRAQKWADTTPPPLPARVVGTLDLLWISTRVFGLKLDDGSIVKGVINEGDISSLKQLLTKRVVVIGKAYFRPSRSLQRIEATSIVKGENETTFWSKVPEAQSEGISNIKAGHNKAGWAKLVGKWPGEETEEELLQSLREIN